MSYNPTTWFDRPNVTPKIKASDLNRIEQGIVAASNRAARVSSTASSSTPSINVDQFDDYILTALAVAITGVTISGTPFDGHLLTLRITDNGTARAIAHGSSFVAGRYPLASATVVGQQLTEVFRYNAALSKYECIESSQFQFVAASKALAPQAYIAGNYYYCFSMNGVSTSAGLGNGTLRLSIWIVTTPVTISKMFAEFTAAGDANSVLRLGVFSDNGNSQPGALVLDAGTISTGSGNAGNITTGGTPGVYEIALGSPLTLQPGIYWAGGVVQGVTTTQPTIRTAGGAQPIPGGPLGTSLPSAGASTPSMAVSGVTGALANISSPGPAGSGPRVGFKVA